MEVSFGQWQKLALARGFMRDDPLLLVLDEPTAALDAETEHALFERYAAAARRVCRVAAGDGNGARGRVTLLVSHRFSTVRMADLIVVLDGARLVESGSHDDADGGRRALRRVVSPASHGLPLTGLPRRASPPRTAPRTERSAEAVRCSLRRSVERCRSRVTR